MFLSREMKIFFLVGKTQDQVDRKEKGNAFKENRFKMFIVSRSWNQIF